MRTLPERRHCHRCQRTERSHGFAQVGYHPELGYVPWPPGEGGPAAAQHQADGAMFTPVQVCATCHDELRHEPLPTGEAQPAGAPLIIDADAFSIE